jgi:hypothetical protein
MSETEARSRVERITPRLGRYFPKFFLGRLTQEMGSLMLLHLPGNWEVAMTRGFAATRPTARPGNR